MQEKKSQNAIFILNKLKKSLKISTDIELSEMLNVKPNTISTWKKRNTLDYNSIIAICELYEINLNDIFSEIKTVRNINSSDTCETPLVCSEVQFQYCIDKESLIENLPRYSFPFIKSDETTVFQVSSNNMYPLIELNSFVICELSTIDAIKNNSIAVIVSKTKGFFINRIARDPKNKNKFIFSNENTFFNDISFEAADINELWLIKGVLSYNFKEENQIKSVHGISIVKPNSIK
jgi:hypothetical protein